MSLPNTRDVERRELLGYRYAVLRLALFLLWLSVAPCSYAAEIEGVTFADQQQVGNLRLVLNNVGLLRYRVIFKGYVAALYLRDGVRPELVLTDVPKRLELAYFWSIAGTYFGKAADKILEQNFSSEFIATLRARLRRLHALYENVKPGDRYTPTYTPGVGTELALNGMLKGTIEGSDFAAAYFAIWLGEKPLDASLKTQLLRLSWGATSPTFLTEGNLNP